MTDKNTTLYKKEGKKYIPVAEEKWWDALPEGVHMIVVAPGLQSYKYQVHPDREGLLAAVAENRELIQTALRDGLHIKAHKNPVTPEQKKAWEDFVKVMGKDGYVVEYESLSKVADDIMDAVMGTYEPRTDYSF